VQTYTVNVVHCVPTQKVVTVPVTTYRTVARQVAVCVPVVTCVPCCY